MPQLKVSRAATKTQCSQINKEIDIKATTTKTSLESSQRKMTPFVYGKELERQQVFISDYGGTMEVRGTRHSVFGVGPSHLQKGGLKGLYKDPADLSFL